MNAMAFVPATNVVQTELIYWFNGETCENVLHYQFPGGASLTLMDQLGSALVGWWNTNIKPLVTDDVALNLVRMTDLTTQISPVLEYSTGLPIVGTAAGDTLPNNCAIVLTKRTANRGRSYRGRIYHMGIPETQVTGNTVAAAHLASLTAAYNMIEELIIASLTVPMVVVSRFSGGVERSSAVVTPVTVITGNNVIDSQRRRLPGRGN